MTYDTGFLLWVRCIPLKFNVTLCLIYGGDERYGGVTYKMTSWWLVSLTRRMALPSYCLCFWTFDLLISSLLRHPVIYSICFSVHLGDFCFYSVFTLHCHSSFSFHPHLKVIIQWPTRRRKINQKIYRTRNNNKMLSKTYLVKY